MAKDGQYFKEAEETAYEMITREYFITDGLKWF